MIGLKEIIMTTKNNESPYDVASSRRKGEQRVSNPGYKLVETLRSSGYNYWSLAGELCDNSIDAGATWIRCYLLDENGKTGGKTRTIDKLVFIDNGSGMTEAVAEQCHQICSDRAYDDRDIGKFGLGGIASSISVGRRRLTITRDPDTRQIFGIETDLDEIARCGQIVIRYLKEDELPEPELSLFKKHIKKNMTGTLACVTELDKMSSIRADNVKAVLTGYLGETYYKHIMKREVSFYFDDRDTPIAHKHPILLNEEGVETVFDGEIDIDSTKIEITVVDLYNHPDMAGRGLKGQGLYINRGDRLICKGVCNDPEKNVEGFWNRHADYRDCRVLITIPVSADEHLGVNYKKTEFAWSKPLNDKVAAIVIPYAKSMQNRRKSATPADTRLEREKVLEKVQSKLSTKKGVAYTLHYDNLGAQSPASTHSGKDLYINLDFPTTQKVLAGKNSAAKTTYIETMISWEIAFAALGEPDTSEIEEERRRLHSEISNNLAFFCD
jgi:hypothetical protein